MFVSVIVVLIVAAAWFFFGKKRRPSRLPPGPKGVPFLGVAMEFDMLTAYKILPKWAEEFGPLYSFRVAGINTIVINDARLVRKAFADDEFQSVFNDRPKSCFGKHMLYDSADVLLSQWEDALRLRKYLHKGLHLYGGGVADFEKLVTDELHRFVTDLRTVEGDVDPRAKVETSICMLIAALLTGESGEASQNKGLMFEFIESVNKLMDPVYDMVMQALPLLRLIPGRFRSVFLRALSSRDRVLEKFYHQQKATYKEGKRRGLVDFFTCLQNELAENSESDLFTDDNFKGIIMDTIVAGVLTSTNTLLWILLALLNHPDCMAKIRSDVDAKVGKSRFPRLSDRSQMPYTEAVVMETLRYVSLTPFLTPHRARRDVQFEGYDVPKDTQILANLWFINHDEKVWGDPWTFRPERFLDEEGQLVSPTHPARQAYLAFGVGKRHCVGEVMAKSRIFLYVTTLLQRFDVTPSASLTPFDPRTHVTAGAALETPPFTCRFIPRQ